MVLGYEGDRGEKEWWERKWTRNQGADPQRLGNHAKKMALWEPLKNVEGMTRSLGFC